MKTAFSIILFFLGLHFCNSQNSVIYGKIIPENPSDSLLIKKKTKVILYINGKEKQSKVDKNLLFKFDKLDSGTVVIITKPKSARVESITKGFLKLNDTINIEIPYMLTCKYDKSVKNKICPICKSEDQVIPIAYGLLVSIKKKGEESKELEYKEGGCVITNCDPNWYCKRDDIDF